MRATQSTIQLLVVCVISFVISCKDNPIDSDQRFEAGPILFVSVKSGSGQLYSMNEDGSDMKQLTRDPNFPIGDARWSPDGSKPLFVSGATDGTTRTYIYTVNIDGTGLRRLLNDLSANSPDWSR